MGVVVKMTLGTFYLIGATLLLPGFVWIQPIEPWLCVVSFGPGTPPKPMPCMGVPTGGTIVAKIPNFKTQPSPSANPMDPAQVYGNVYGQGDWCIVIGCFLFIVASVIDFVSAIGNPYHPHDPPERTAAVPLVNPVAADQASGQSTEATSTAGGSGLIRMLGPTLMVIGSSLIFLGSVFFLPRFAMGGPPSDPSQGAPLYIFCSEKKDNGDCKTGTNFVDFGSLMFQIAAFVFLGSAFTAIYGVAMGISAARKAGRPTCNLWFSLLAFVCFIPCSTLYFANSFVEDDIEAGHWRMAGTIFLSSACYILFAVTLYEVCLAAPKGATSAPDDQQQSLQAARP